MSVFSEGEYTTCYHILALTDSKINSQIQHNYHITCTYLHWINKNIFHLSTWAELLYRNKCWTCKCAYNEMRYQLLIILKVHYNHNKFNQPSKHSKSTRSSEIMQLSDVTKTISKYVCPWLTRANVGMMTRNLIILKREQSEFVPVLAATSILESTVYFVLMYLRVCCPTSVHNPCINCNHWSDGWWQDNLQGEFTRPMSESWRFTG